MNVSIRSLTMSDGDVIDVSSSELVVFVGPNNVGKSTALREINEHGNRLNGSTRVIKSINLKKDGDGQQLIEWLEGNTEKRRVGDSFDEWGYVRLQSQYPISSRMAQESWGAPDGLGSLWSLMSLYLDAVTRLSATTAAPYDLRQERPQSPVQYLWTSKKLQGELSKISEKVFGNPLTLSPYPPSLSLHLGRWTEQPKSPYPDEKSAEQLHNLPMLDAQGHGMRSFMYIALSMMTHNNFCVLIDEPEVFLHPPQARALGRRLRMAAGSETQIFVSTHSSDILRGILSGSSNSAVSVIRITREGDENHGHVLKPDRVKGLWSDPILRYSNLLDGLFHHTTVLCEGDADCKFYSAVLDQLESEELHSPEDVHFTYTSGKHRIASMAQTLGAISVDVRVIVDIDIFDDERVLTKLIEAQGGNLTDTMKTDLRRLQAAVANVGKPLKQDFVKQELKELIETFDIGNITEQQSQKLRSLSSSQSGWGAVKNAGKAAIPSGEATQAFINLTTELEKMNIFVVEVGTLEQFVPEEGGHGPKWLASVLENGREKEAAKGAAGKLMEKVAHRSL